MKELDVKGYIVLVDDDIYEEYQNKKLYISSHGYPVQNKTYLHTIVLGKRPGFVIDHIDGDKLNNQRSNLRHATRSQNAQNVRKRNRPYEYIGVSKEGEKWKARCKNKHLGYFTNIEHAAYAYDLYCITLFGEDALLNNISKPDDWDDNYTVPNSIRKMPKGVRKSGKKFAAVYSYDRKMKHIGMFHTIDDAAEAVNNAEKVRDEELLEKHYNRSIIYHNEMAAIPIKNSKGDILYHAYVDDDKWHDLMLTRWANSRQYCSGRRNGKSISMHRYVLNYDGPLVVDHINSNKHDNRVENLRIVTHSVNMQNCAKKQGCASKYIGVKKSAKGRFPWNSEMRYKGKMLYLGNFYTEEEAARKYNEKAIELYGPNCRLNIFE